MSDILKIDSIEDIHHYISYNRPVHPMITLLKTGMMKGYKKAGKMTFELGFYAVTLKHGEECTFEYGRNKCDFMEGSLICTAPGQQISIDFDTAGLPLKGWMLCFHPDFIRGSNVGNRMKDYTYFNYRANEALHLSEKEESTINGIVSVIEDEISMNLDIYSHDIIISNIEVLLNYCQRFYGRQFITRRPINNEIVIRFEELLNQRFSRDQLDQSGIPTVSEVADIMGYSSNYLSDLLKKETGRSTQDHIHYHIIETAKDMLVGSSMSVSNIAYALGYMYPEHFMKFFKKKVGMTPSEYRKSY